MLQAGDGLEHGKLNVAGQGGRNPVRDRSCRRPALPAPGRSGAVPYRRTGRPCPRSRDSSAGRRPRSGPSTSAPGAGSPGWFHGPAGVVQVTWQGTWGVVIRSVRVEKGGGGSSPGWHSSPAQSMVRPSRRGGVPVFRRPSGKPGAAERFGQAEGRSFTDAAGRDLLLAQVDQPAQERARGQDDGTGADRRAAGGDDAGNAAVIAQDQVLDGVAAADRGWAAPPGRLHRLAVEARGRPGRGDRERRVPCFGSGCGTGYRRGR